MPFTVNGVGTHYYGKNRVHTIRERCEHCGAVADLTSYDTGNYLVVLFVPVIPLGKKRILSECPFCTKHRALPLKKWEELKSADVGEVTAELKANPDDPEVIKKVFGVATGYQDEPLLMLAASAVAAKFSKRADVLASLAECLEYFSRLKEAEAAYRASLAIADAPETRERLAMTLIKQLKPQEARPYLQHILDEKAADKTGYLWMLAEGYQAVGDHVGAVEILTESAEINPAWVNDKDYKTKLKQSQKMIEKGRDKPIASAWFGAKKPEGYTEGGIGGRIAQWLPVIIGVVCLVVYLGMAISAGQSRTVHLVNGLSRAYTVVLNGQQYPVGGRSRSAVRIPEGKISVRIDDGINQLPLGIPETTVDLSTNFWTRPFFKPVIIINPDRTAWIEWEKNFYGANPQAVPSPEFESTSGKALVVKWGIDHEFEPLPEQIRVKSKSGPVSRTGINFRAIDTANVTEMSMLSRELNGDELQRVFQLLASAEPDNELVVALFARMAVPDAVKAWFDAGLPTRPILLTVHRKYQDFIERTNPEKDLAAEYRELASREPENDDLKYLLSRAVNDVDEQKAILTAVIEKSPNHVFAKASLAHLNLAQGNFAEAKNLVDQVIVRQSANIGFQAIRDEAWVATNQTKELADLYARYVPQGKLFSFPLQYPFLQELRFRAVAGDLEGTKRRMGEFRQQALIQQAPAEIVEPMVTSLLRRHFLVSGNWAEYKKLKPPSERPAREDLMIDRKWEEAAKIASDPDQEDDEGMTLLTIGVLAELDGKPDVAAPIKQQAAEKLRGDSAIKRELKQVLLGKVDQVDVEKNLKFNSQLSDKVVILLALGQRFPGDRDRYFALARQLNLPISFESRLLQEVLK